MITKTEHHRRMYVKTYDSGFKDKIHLELHIVTTYWFLFIPIYRSVKLLNSNI